MMNETPLGSQLLQLFSHALDAWHTIPTYPNPHLARALLKARAPFDSSSKKLHDSWACRANSNRFHDLQWLAAHLFILSYPAASLHSASAAWPQFTFQDISQSVASSGIQMHPASLGRPPRPPNWSEASAVASQCYGADLPDFTAVRHIVTSSRWLRHKQLTSFGYVWILYIYIYMCVCLYIYIYIYIFESCDTSPLISLSISLVILGHSESLINWMLFGTVSSEFDRAGRHW